VLPANYPGIRFDENGVCNYCHQTKEIELLGEEKFLERIDEFRNSPGKYDCMVALSGGRDSTYVLWYAVRKLGLRTLACFVDNGFVPEQTHKNIKEATDRLGVDLVIKKHDLVGKSAGHTMRSWMKRPTPGMIPLLCSGCTLGLRIGLMEAAKENNIKMMLYGVGEPEQSFAEKYMNPDPNGAITKKSLAIGFFSEIAGNPRYAFSPRAVVSYAKEFLFRWSKPFQRRVVRGIKPPDLVQVEPFYYMQWDEDEIMSVITNELGWERCPHTENAWRADCTIAIFKNYLYNETVGFSKVEELLSNLIRYDMISREDAIERLGRDRVISEDLISELFAQLDLDVSDLEKALVKAKKSKHYLKVD
jgi:tRNA(Ile)-lysidine synthase TilS/MesJ